MAQYNENTLPVLKYLRWRNELKNHPDFIKARMKARTMSTRDLMTKEPFPFLWPKDMRVNSENVMAATDAIFGLSKVWPEFAEAASTKIEALSKTFITAMDSSYGAFLKAELFKELEDKDLKGTLIFPGGEVICYDFIMESPEEKDGKLTYLISGNAMRLLEGKHLVCDHFDDVDKDGNPEGTSSWHDFEKKQWKTPKDGPAEPGTVGEWMDQHGIEIKITDDTNENVLGMFDCILVYHLFKKYAPIEEVVSVRERKEHHDLPDIKTNQPIEYYDCGWYTTIIRNEGFSVRGHFRLQPCGAGKKDKKLIYIHEFQKHGYVRRARLLLNEIKED
jgi:hypothetical protein